MLYGSFTVPDPIRTSVVGVGLFARFKRLPELNPAMPQPECYRLNPSPQAAQLLERGHQSYRVWIPLLGSQQTGIHLSSRRPSCRQLERQYVVARIYATPRLIH